MATQKIDPHDLEAAPAAADLSAKQFHLVKLTEAGELALAGAGDIAFSLQDKPKQGQFGTYAAAGSPKAVAGGNIKAGDLLSSNAEGKLVAATATKVEEEKVKTLGSRVIGVALETGVSGDVLRYRATPAGGRA